VLTLTRTEHLQRRRLEARLFARDALHISEQSVLLPAVKRRLAARTALRTDPVDPVGDDLLVFSRMVLVEMTARLIGLDGVEDDEQLELLYSCAERFGEAASVEWALTDHGEIMAAGLAASDEFVERWFASSYRRRRELLESGAELPVDLLSLLLAHAKELDEDEVRREAIFFLLASSSTTTHAVPISPQSSSPGSRTTPTMPPSSATWASSARWSTRASGCTRRSLPSCGGRCAT